MAPPLASRVMTKAHLKSLSPAEMEKYINHHVRVAGAKQQLFEPAAITAIHQGSAGGLRRANQLALGGLMAAAIEKRDSVSAYQSRGRRTYLTKGQEHERTAFLGSETPRCLHYPAHTVP